MKQNVPVPDAIAGYLGRASKGRSKSACLGHAGDFLVIGGNYGTVDHGQRAYDLADPCNHRHPEHRPQVL
jgi:hypothetical protein